MVKKITKVAAEIVSGAQTTKKKTAPKLDYVVIEHKAEKLISYTHRADIIIGGNIAEISSFGTEEKAADAARIYAKANKKESQY